jgi:hypothetical protein
MMLRCEQQYAFRYIMGLRSPPGVALLEGSSLHSTQEIRLTDVLLGKETLLNADQTADLAVNHLEQRLDAEEVVFNKDETPDKSKDSVAKMAKVMVDELHPKFEREILRVEHKYDLDLEGKDVSLQAVTDVEQAGAKIRDLKVTKRTPDPTHELQPACYAYCYWQEQQDIPSFYYDVVKRLKTPKSEVVSYQPDMMDIQKFFTIFDTIAERIKQATETGLWIPNPTGWWCDERWCGYWSECKGGRLL